MKRVVSIINRGKSCFIAALIFSYSLLAISKSCSNCTEVNQRHNRDTGRNHLVEMLLVAEGLLFLIPQLCQRVIEAVVVYQLEIGGWESRSRKIYT
jgi:hypothetical protein